MRERPGKWEERITATLLSKLRAEYPVESKKFWDRWAEADAMMDIDESFVGFLDNYFFLSRMIPTDRIILDIGCAYAFQSYYFRDHALYIGIDTGEIKDRLVLPHTEHINLHVEVPKQLETIRYQWVPQNTPCFAICNYVPGRTARFVSQVFPDCFCFYPQHSDSNAKLEEIRRFASAQAAAMAKDAAESCDGCWENANYPPDQCWYPHTCGKYKEADGFPPLDDDKDE